MSYETLSDGRRRMTVRGEGNYLWLPICESDKKEELICENEAGTLWRFLVPAFSENSKILFYSALPKEGSKVTLTGNFPEDFFDAVQVRDGRAAAADIHPVLHFAADNGWLNDPNGLIWNNGIYHMYFQHNPVDTVWENMCWGHAVSTDLLHWKQVDDVMYPDGNGTIFSGSAIENRQGLLGLPDDALLFYYTCAGSTSKWSENKPFTQDIAYSLDDGKTLTKWKTAVPQITDKNRDPKIYFYPEKNIYYMVLYLENNEFAILNSKDMLHFEITQHIRMEGSGECPDLRRIPCEDGTEQWILMQADGNYYIGAFDGSIFTPDSELQNAYGTYLPYAAQTFNKPDDRVIHVAFLRVESKNCTYTNTMSLPREMAFIRKDGGYTLQLKPVKEYFKARRKTDDLIFDLSQSRAVEAEISMKNAAFAEVTIGKIKVAYNKETGKLRVDDNEIDFEKSADVLHILIDKGILEISPDDYTHPAYFEVREDLQQGEISVNLDSKYSSDDNLFFSSVFNEKIMLDS